MEAEPTSPKPIYKFPAFWVAVVIVLYYVFYQFSQPSAEELRKENEIINAQANREKAERDKESDRKHTLLVSYLKDLTITNETWHKSGFGNVAIHSFTIKNSSKDYIYQDITVRFHYMGQSGTEISQHDETIYKAVAKQRPIKVRDLNAGLIDKQVVTVRSEIVGATNTGAY